MGEQQNEQAIPEITVRTTVSQRGHHHFIIERDGDPIASSHQLDKYSSAKAALAAADSLIGPMKETGSAQGYKVGHEKGFAAGQRTGKREGAEAAKVEANRAHNEAISTLSSEHNAKLDELNEKHRHALAKATEDGYDRGQNKGAIWGLIVASTVSIGIMFLLYHFGALDRWFG